MPLKLNDFIEHLQDLQGREILKKQPVFPGGQLARTLKGVPQGIRVWQNAQAGMVFQWKRRRPLGLSFDLWALIPNPVDHHAKSVLIALNY